jgi:dihydrodipicolinate synthase/N-acetylneuraminate lyase
MRTAFTDRARQVVLLAPEEAKRLGADRVSTAHLLLALARIPDSRAAQVLSRLGVSLEGVRAAAEGGQDGPAEDRVEAPQLTSQGKRAVMGVYEESRGLGHSYIGTEHLLLALMRDPQSQAGSILSRLGLSVEHVEREIQNLAAAAQSKRAEEGAEGRPLLGVAAALLPFEEGGRIAEEAFAAHLRATHAAGLVNAVNMDTGYVNYLAEEEIERVLRIARAAVGPEAPLIAGCYVERYTDAGEGYAKEVQRAARHGATPILFPTSLLHGAPPKEKIKPYAQAAALMDACYAFELSPRFAPNGELYEDEFFERLMDVPQIKGMKHSSLDRELELRRLEQRDKHRPEFHIFTGNDLAIDMVEHGSDYLLGLATFCPEKFAERDRLLPSRDSGYKELTSALQHLGNVAFREPIPAYKHSAAHFLHMAGRIPTSEPHRECQRRPEWEPEILADCARRLGITVDARSPR